MYLNVTKGTKLHRRSFMKAEFYICSGLLRSNKVYRDEYAILKEGDYVAGIITGHLHKIGATNSRLYRGCRKRCCRNGGVRDLKLSSHKRGKYQGRRHPWEEMEGRHTTALYVIW